MNIIEYETKTGKKRYKFSLYAGKDTSIENIKGKKKRL